MVEEDVNKIYNIRKQMQATYKFTTNADRKQRLASYLKELDLIIKDIESGNPVNPVKLNILTHSSSDNDSNDVQTKNIEIEGTYEDKVPHIKICENSKDEELDFIFSFIIYFDTNFMSPFGQANLKLDYNFSKIRDEVIENYEAIKRLVDQYIADYKLLSNFINKDQIVQYKERLRLSRHFLLVRLNEVFSDIDNFLTKLVTDMAEGRKSMTNAQEKYTDDFSAEEDKSEFECKTMGYIVKEAKNFVDEFLEIIKIPGFRK